VGLASRAAAGVWCLQGQFNQNFGTWCEADSSGAIVFDLISLVECTCPNLDKRHCALYVLQSHLSIEVRAFEIAKLSDDNMHRPISPLTREVI
jgi:hypothetical protein